MVTVTVAVESATVEFDDLLEAVRLDPDEGAEPPWENSDGFEHTVISDETEGAAAGSFFGDRNSRYHGRHRVVVKKDQWSNFKYWRVHGASKQVAYELARLEERRTAELIAGWYDYGWEVWCISCHFKGVRDSCCGFYGESGSDYIKECMAEIAKNVALELQKDGYTVNGIPDEKEERRRNHLYHLKHNLHQQDHIVDKEKFLKKLIQPKPKQERKT